MKQLCKVRCHLWVGQKGGARGRLRKQACSCSRGGQHKGIIVHMLQHQRIQGIHLQSVSTKPRPGDNPSTPQSEAQACLILLPLEFDQQIMYSCWQSKCTHQPGSGQHGSARFIRAQDPNGLHNLQQQSCLVAASCSSACAATSCQLSKEVVQAGGTKHHGIAVPGDVQLSQAA